MIQKSKPEIEIYEIKNLGSKKYTKIKLWATELGNM